jgi:F420-non-reducing hydrogenase large subunit
MAQMRKISIDPITRLEGHGRVDVFLDEEGNVAECLLVVPELRGFEKILEGRPVEELPLITSRICGVCPEAHHTASVKAIEALYKVRIPPTAELIRRLQYNIFAAGDHATHFYALGGPDFIVKPDADRSQRNIIGVIAKVGGEIAGRLIRFRKEAHEAAELLGGRRIHPVGMVPGGQSRPVTREMQKRLIEIAEFAVEFCKFTQQAFADIVLVEPRYQEMLKADAFQSRTYYMGLVNEKNQPDMYDGKIRIVDAEGRQVTEFRPQEYLDHIAEQTAPWTYVKIPYLKKVGWRGFTDGAESGVVRVAPLAMLNAADSMQTPLAQAEYEKMMETLGGRPVHAVFAYHWARIIEMLQCSELALRAAKDERLTSPDIRTLPTATPTEGVGIVEAPRGLLIHHYTTDEKGIVRRANLIVGTTHNYAGIQTSLKKAAMGLLRRGTTPDETALNNMEMVIRAYDPCFGCATHFFGAKRMFDFNCYEKNGSLLWTASRDEDGVTIS